MRVWQFSSVVRQEEKDSFALKLRFPDLPTVDWLKSEGVPTDVLEVELERTSRANEKR